MNISDIQKCARFYKSEYMEKFYIVTTYCGNGFVLVAEKGNFPHLMGIKKNIYRSNGYRNSDRLYEDLIKRKKINKNIIPNNISSTSKMYKKALNFMDSIDIFWDNSGPIAVNYNQAISSSRLNNISLLLVDIGSGYMTGWVESAHISLNSESKLKKYCICTWIDESKGPQSQKEKYMHSQDIELIKNVLAFDKNSRLVEEKTYSYDREEKKEILLSLQRNNSNLLIDRINEREYKEIAIKEKIHCSINGRKY